LLLLSFLIFGMVSPEMRSFSPLLRRIVARRFSGAPTELARRLHIAPSQLSRAMSRHHPQPFDIPGCLRLAQVSGENPSTILRAAGKADVARLLEQLYGPPRPPLAPQLQALVTAWMAIRQPDVRDGLLVTIQALRGQPRSHSPKGGATGGSGPGTPVADDPDTTPIPDTIMLPDLRPHERPVSRGVRRVA
jgi:hypothetical protein